MKKHEILALLERFPYDAKDYWLVSGGAMVLYGIREETADIDLGCDPALADRLEADGVPVRRARDGIRWFRYGEHIEIFENWLYYSIAEVDGLRVISIDGLIAMKQALGREKDLRDLRLIRDHLAGKRLGEKSLAFLDTDFLESGEIKLVVDRLAEGDPVKNWVPAYHFHICDRQGMRMGYCDLRIGYNEKLYYGGHIGYGVAKEFRGHHYAAKACELLFSLARRHGMEYLYISCSPDNWPSRKTLEYLHGELLEIAELPEYNDMRVEEGETQKCVFRFEL